MIRFGSLWWRAIHFRLDDLGSGEVAVDQAQLIRRVNQVQGALDDHDPSVVLVDTRFPEGGGFEAIGQVLEHAPGVKVLALTPDPPPHGDVARAARAGASGFIEVGAEPSDFAAALDAVERGGTWFPEEEVLQVLAAVADDLETSRAESRSRLTGVLLALIPLTGAIAALMSLLWRKYVGQIGVRPVDIAVDPASRVVDALAGMSLVLAVFGPLLFVGGWLDLLRSSPANRGPLAWFLGKPKTAHLVSSVVLLAAMVFLAQGPHLFLVMVVGPTVAVSLAARAVDVSDQIPRILRIDNIRPMRIVFGGCAALILFLAALSVEGLVVGPRFGTRGEGGWLAPRVLGFSAQPMLAFEVDSDKEPREVLYIGGNADLYVLVDPCDENTVEFVSVGRHKLVVIDEITCATN